MSIARQIAFLIAFGIITLWLWLFLLRWRITRAQKQVSEAFRRHGALSPARAMTVEELGVAQRPMIGLRNFRRMALQAMVAAGIVIAVEGNRLYLSEEAIQAAIAAHQKKEKGK